MTAEFQFSQEQRVAIAELLGTEKGIRNLEKDVRDYIYETAQRISPSEIRDLLKDAQKHSRGLIKAINALSRRHKASSSWLLEPLVECEHYATALLKYRFSRRLKPGRLPHIPEIHLVQRVALIWEDVTGKVPGRGRGPFATLIGLLFEYSGVHVNPQQYPEELVAEALPAGLSIGIVGKDYPFTLLEDSIDLPSPKREAEDFFSMVLWVANGSPTAFTMQSKPKGENQEEN